MKNIFYLVGVLLLVVSCNNPDSQKLESKKRVDDISKIKNDALLDSLENEHNESVLSSGDNVTNAYIFLVDSTFSIRADIKKDHRIIGYAKPNINSERLIFFSIFTGDVEGNPFGCELGAYYDTEWIENTYLKFIDAQDDFVKVIAIEEPNTVTELYFEKKWIIFE